MEPHELSALPGAELVLAGLRDIEQGHESMAALLVLVGAPRLRSLGVAVPASEHSVLPEHRLYAWANRSIERLIPAINTPRL